MNDRRLWVALLNLAALGLAVAVQHDPELLTRARALRAGATGTGWAATLLYRAANRTSALSLRLHDDYLREVT
jgi:hypothetical protein